MRNFGLLLILAGVVAFLPSNVLRGDTNPPVIVSFRNGLLQWSDSTNGLYRIEWASALDEPWQSSYTNLQSVAEGVTNVYSAKVPMFYRVVRVAKPVAGGEDRGTLVLDPTRATPAPSCGMEGPALWATIDGTVFQLAILENGKVLNLRSGFSLSLGDRTELTAQVTPLMPGRYEWEARGNALSIDSPTSRTVNVTAVDAGHSEIRFRFFPHGVMAEKAK